jgi:hypothetical protein
MAKSWTSAIRIGSDMDKGVKPSQKYELSA